MKILGLFVWTALTLIFVAPHSFGADKKTVKLSLEKVFRELTVEDREYDAIPIGEDSEPLFTAGGIASAKRVKRKMGMYPIQKFATDHSGQFVAIQLHAAAVPKDSKLERKVILLKIENDRVEIYRQFAPEKSSGAYPAKIEFLEDSSLRIRWYDDGHKSNYEIFNPRTLQTKNLSEALPFKSIKSVLAYDENFYIAEHGKEKSTYSIFEHNFADGKTHVLGEINHGIQFLHSIVEERHVFKMSNNEVWVKANVPVNNQWLAKILKISKAGFKVVPNTLSDSQQSLVRGDSNLVVTEIGNNIRLENAQTGKKVVEWTLNTDTVYPTSEYSNFTKVPGGYVANASNHPNYGYYFLKDDGTWEQLTELRFRLIHSSIQPHFVLGLGDLEKGYQVGLYRIDFSEPPADEKKAADQPIVPEFGQPIKFPLVRTLPNTRYVIVRKAPLELGIVDMAGGQEIVKVIKLMDETFSIEVLSSTIAISYAEIGKKYIYRTPSFEFAFTHDIPKNSACERILK